MNTPDLPEEKPSAPDKRNCTLQAAIPEALPPVVTGQCADVLHLLRTLQPVPSVVLTADQAIPETAARIDELWAKGYNIMTTILPEFGFRGLVRRNGALYSMGTPEWPVPGFVTGSEGGGHVEGS